MGVKILGVDTPLDSQAEVPFGNDVDIPGQYRKGGFYKPGGVSSLVEPTTGAQGTSLSSVPKGAYVNPSTGQMELLPETRAAPGGFNLLNILNALPLPPTARGAIAGAGAMASSPAQGPGLTPAQMAHGPSDPADLLPKAAFQPNFVRPEGQIQRTFPMWPTPGPGMPLGAAPGAAPSNPVAASPAGPVSPQRATPRAAGPAAVAQQPNLGNYGASPFTTLDYRPNSGPNERNRGSPVATALDLSRLFGGGAPAVNPNAPAVAAQPVSATAPAKDTPYLDTRSRAPGTMGPLQKGAVWPKEMGPKKRPKSSSSSQSGNY